jgi:dUTP pyrophosphatase
VIFMVGDECVFCHALLNATLNVVRIHPLAKVPTKRMEDSGYDLYGIIEKDVLVLPPHSNVIIPTGLVMEFPRGFGFVVCNRGSVGTKSAIVGAHIVDSGYRGEVKIDLHNISEKFIYITTLTLDEIYKKILGVQSPEDIVVLNKNDALTQGMIVPTLHLPVVEKSSVDELTSSDRGVNAFGSTNKS